MAYWLPQPVRWANLVHLGFPCWYHKKNISLLSLFGQDSWILVSLLLTSSQSIETQRRTWPISSHNKDDMTICCKHGPRRGGGGGYSGFQVTGMIEWEQKSRPKKISRASNKTQKNPWTKNKPLKNPMPNFWPLKF